MQVNVEKTGAVGRRMKVEIPEQQIADAVDSRLRSLVRTTKVPGFRPGKVPLKVIVRQYGRRVRDEVIGELIRTSFQDALTQERLRLVGLPTIEPMHALPGEGLSYTAVFEVYPEVSLSRVEGLSIRCPTAQIQEADVDRMLERLRLQRKSWKVVERPAAQGDRVIVDFHATLNNEGITVGKGEEIPVELGAGRMLKGFEEGLIGAVAGNELTLTLTYPADYSVAELAGKPATFAVKVRAVETASIPELDAAFAQEVGVQAGGVDALRSAVRENLSRELQSAIKARTRQRVLDALLAANPVDLPQSLIEIETEMEQMKRKRLEALTGLGLDPDRFPTDEAQLEQKARRRITMGLILTELVSRNDMKPDSEQVRARVESLAAASGKPDQVIQWYYSHPGRLAEVEAELLEQQVIDWVLERAEVTNDETSFDELVNPGQTTDRTM